MKIGLLGGTFNPIHIGHLTLAQECWHQLTLDKVIFIPAYINPLKQKEGEVTPADRLNMIRLALEGDTRYTISTYEIDVAKTSYSIDTVKHIKGTCGTLDELFFITGADSAETLQSWKDMGQILDLTTFVIATRPGWNEETTYENRIKRIIIPEVDVSSTLVRQRIADRKPIDYLVPKKVVKYIRDKGLYRI